jgi:hypothetical protein
MRRILSAPHGGGVYLFRALDGILWKIGASTRVVGRLRSVSTIQRPCELVHIIRTNDLFRLENYLHHCFIRKRHDGDGTREWFRLDPRDVTLLCQLTFVEMVGKKPADKTVRLHLEPAYAQSRGTLV